jgi:acetoin utilization deacetylase AcuC-like enzyme
LPARRFCFRGTLEAMLIVVGPVEAEAHARRSHPERPERVGAVMRGVENLHLGSDLSVLATRSADVAELQRVHTAEYLEDLRRHCAEGAGPLDPDTYATPESWEAARQSAGAGLVAVEALRKAGDGVAFVVARPPGHHALAGRPMGFCLLNNVAVAAAQLVDAGERVLIVDWDVHHGNGTEALFWDEPRVLYVSTHQWPCYPGTGRAGDIGGPSARGTTLNVPLPPGSTGDVLERAFDELVSPAVAAFEPSWVLVSAGFDAHRADPLADLSLSAGDFARLAPVVAGYAPAPGRTVWFLEGGYDLGALQASVTATFGALVGWGGQVEPPTAGGPGHDQVKKAGAERHALLE